MEKKLKLYTMRPDGRCKDGLIELISTAEKALGRGLKMVEIGSYAGESSEIFARSGVFSKVICVDPWTNGYDPRDYASKTTELAEKKFDKVAEKYSCIEKLKRYSKQAAEKFEDWSLDLIYIDATHTYEGVKNDIESWFNKIRPGGIISGHDYSTGWGGVMRAVDEKFGKPDKTFRDSSWLVFMKNDRSIINKTKIMSIGGNCAGINFLGNFRVRGPVDNWFAHNGIVDSLSLVDGFEEQIKNGCICLLTILMVT